MIKFYMNTKLIETIKDISEISLLIDISYNK